MAAEESNITPIRQSDSAIQFVEISPNVVTTLSQGGWWAIGFQTTVPAVSTVYYGPAKDPVPQYLYKQDSFTREYVTDHNVAVLANEGTTYDVKIVGYDKGGNPAFYEFRATAQRIEGGGIGGPSTPPPEEVVVGPPPGPVDPLTDLWVDNSVTPPVINVRVAGAWTPITTTVTSEVHVGTTDPTATEPTTELWYNPTVTMRSVTEDQYAALQKEVAELRAILSDLRGK